MLIKYKRNGKSAIQPFMESSTPQEPPPKLCGPFVSCGGCNYASNGFLCYHCEGDCLRTVEQKMKERHTR